MHVCVGAAAKKNALNAIERAIDVDFCAALAEPARLAIIKVLLRQGVSDVGSIAAQLSQDRSVVSRHLKQMHTVGLVRLQKEGRQRLYTLDGTTILKRLEDMAAALRQAMACCCPEELPAAD